MFQTIEWQHFLVLFCCIFWLFVYFFVLGPFLVWYTGASDLDGNATITSKVADNDAKGKFMKFNCTKNQLYL